MLQIAQFIALLFTVLAMAPAMAHLLELPNKIRMSGREYLTVQRVYRGWAFAGVLVTAALFSTASLAVLARDVTTLVFAVLAFVCIATTQVVFWFFTFPVNRRTHDWTELPDNWRRLREQWEYSHATTAAFNLTAVVAVILSVLFAGVPTT